MAAPGAFGPMGASLPMTSRRSFSLLITVKACSSSSRRRQAACSIKCAKAEFHGRPAGSSVAENSPLLTLAAMLRRIATILSHRARTSA